LHAELSVGGAFAEVSRANFNLVAKFGGFFIGFCDAGFVTFGNLLNTDRSWIALLRWY
jgi:hypothetical protein